MSMQKIVLEGKDGERIREIELPAQNEPDAIVMAGRVFIRRPMLQPNPPKKNDPERYFEATTVQFSVEPGPAFDKVTEPAAPEKVEPFDRVTKGDVETLEMRDRSGRKPDEDDDEPVLAAGSGRRR